MANAEMGAERRRGQVGLNPAKTKGVFNLALNSPRLAAFRDKPLAKVYTMDRTRPIKTYAGFVRAQKRFVAEIHQMVQDGWDLLELPSISVADGESPITFRCVLTRD